MDVAKLSLANPNSKDPKETFNFDDFKRCYPNEDEAKSIPYYFLQRQEKIRKQIFASMCLSGEDNNSTISGIWVRHGQVLAFTLPDWLVNYEMYD
ncbi:elongation factor 1-gamma-like [Uranotaenia lowii]|uniref:elongation factor 1-gamma-like n=1 Tax=Uranotaenia lowii TaxID=190385 RepID=UPI002478FB74|nr:elongation factor 1-gamma-like [Uranotaenia lowii]